MSTKEGPIESSQKIRALSASHELHSANLSADQKCPKLQFKNKTEALIYVV